MSDIGVELYKLKSGLIFEDTFNSINSKWTITPIGNYSIVDRPGYLRLTHNALSDTLALLDIPNKESVSLEIIADYNPDSVEDSGGLVVWKSKGEKVEFVEKYSASSQLNVSSWLCNKTGNNFDFYQSYGSGYSFVDSAQLENASKFGAVLKQGDGELKPLDMAMVVVTEGMTLTVADITPGQYLKITPVDGDVITSSPSTGTYAEVLLPALSLEGRLAVMNSDGTVFCELSGVFYGGDIYSVGTELEVRLNGNELSTTEQTDIGLMVGGQLTVTMEVYNPASVSVNGVKISISQYQNAFGWTWCDISTDGGETWSDLASIGSLSPQASSQFLLKVTKGNDYMGLDPLQFNVNVSHD